MILILAGTQEARVLAQALAGEGIAAEASFAGAVAQIEALPIPARIGGFGGAEGFADYLTARGITAVIDATHPFARVMTPRSFAVCRALDLPFLGLERAPWQAVEGDRWTHVAAPEDVADVVPEGARVFLSVGRKEAARYTGLRGHRVWIRSIDPVADLPEGWSHIAGKPPFPQAQEEALLRDAGIDWLVTKNAGGATSYAKIAAARALGVRVAMIDRPMPPEDMARVTEVAEALDWARGLAS
ncbi:cobalt-precorrin-6A reductase [Pseudooceanicola nitratireducens]|uniref:cobalt-precorrin-6A reductase n=1 Tax=Pseudooceanicola nitratireducens TaxID=517719 RepID=UPI0023F4794E|nr:cobalt-precorrin-6A reductase [Pseudooceanicola nitratireducens]